MTLPKPQVCDCFGGSCWRKFCPASSKNRKRQRDDAPRPPEPPTTPPAQEAA